MGEGGIAEGNDHWVTLGNVENARDLGGYTATIDGKEYKIKDEVLFRSGHLKDADVFVLISEHETFGLVYLEAMLQGCITVAAWEGSVDGIIKDGVNGFLCKQDDPEDLAAVIKKIVQLAPDKLQEISKKAQQTALEYTDSKVAARYLAEIS